MMKFDQGRKHPVGEKPRRRPVSQHWTPPFFLQVEVADSDTRVTMFNMNTTITFHLSDRAMTIFGMDDPTDTFWSVPLGKCEIVTQKRTNKIEAPMAVAVELHNKMENTPVINDGDEWGGRVDDRTIAKVALKRLANAIHQD